MMLPGSMVAGAIPKSVLHDVVGENAPGAHHTVGSMAIGCQSVRPSPDATAHKGKTGSAMSKRVEVVTSAVSLIPSAGETLKARRLPGSFTASAEQI